MTKKMLIDAAHPEETRVVIVDSNRVEELDFESRNKRQLRGNVYLARVTRVEPSLQAAFVEYGGNRHGFLAFSEIHPDYYQIPYEDRMALIEAEEAEAKEDEDAEDEVESETPKRKATKSKSRSKSRKSDGSNDEADDSDDGADALAADDEADAKSDRDENVDPDADDVADEADAEVADEQAKVASTRRKRMSRRRYKIQEVIKRGQILLIQAVKEERGNKGAAMTTYLSLAGRYCVLMPNTPRGGGISRKIANSSDRKRLKTVMSDLSVPQGMGVIVRTAGAKRTKVEIKRDYDYLARLWEEIRETTLKSTAPALIHEEGNLVKRSIRDLYNKDIAEVLVQGDEAYKNAKAFIKMLMPSHAKFVKQYKETIPLFLRYNVERQIEASLDSVVQLKSGGYLVIHPTEALVSVDVNSGRSTKERNVERTALRTNLEAAEELARQMRLRDLAGLIVIDFIDMDENRNNRAVEKKMKDAISQDRARIQSSRISQFGLMEISRQRRRRSLLEGSTAHCEHCEGVGRKRTIESSALAAIRAVEEFGVRGKARRICLKTSPDVALYLFNEKRSLLQEVDEKSDVFTEVIGDDTLIRPSYQIEIIEAREEGREDPLVEIERAFKRERQKDQQNAKRKSRKNDDEETSEDKKSDESQSRRHKDDSEPNEDTSKRRSRRGRRGGRGRKSREDNRNTSEGTNADNKTDLETPPENTADKTEKTSKGRRKSAPKRKRNTQNSSTSSETNPTEADKDKPAEKAVKKARSTARRKAPTRKASSSEAPQSKTVQDPKAESKPRDNKVTDKAPQAKRSSARRKAPNRKSSSEKTANDDSVKTKKPSAKRKAPAKAPSKAKAAAKPKAPAKKAAPKKKAAPAKAKAPAKKAATAKAKAPAKKAAPAKTKEPAKKTAPKKAPSPKANTLEKTTPPASPKPSVKSDTQTPSTTDNTATSGINANNSASDTKKSSKKKGLWNRLLKS
ncbi:MAG: Rne/Rng family ribonuclease [Litorimonas sp.]